MDRTYHYSGRKNPKESTGWAFASKNNSWQTLGKIGGDGRPTMFNKIEGANVLGGNGLIFL